jgi:hypothetical protein
LYAGASAAQNINNGINLSLNGGLVWIKNRTNANSHYWLDTARGIGGTGTSYYLRSDSTSSEGSFTNWMQTNTTGFALLSGSSGTAANATGYNYASWTFSKRQKFFDVVTYSGTGAVATITHNLGSVPGFIIIKGTNDGTENWRVYHTSLGNAQSLYLNTTAAALGTSVWNSTSPTSTGFTVSGSPAVNGSGITYVAYLFASNAGGFGASGSDNVVSCGNFSFSAGKATVTLGYEPQYLLMKRTDSAEQWWVYDTMRGMTASLSPNNYLTPNSTAIEADFGSITQPTATGFYLDWSNNGVTTGNYIYIAIRRGPMKTPTDATTVFAAQNNRNGPGSATAPSFVSNFPIDMFMRGYKPGASASFQWLDDRLRQAYLVTSATDAEATIAWKFDSQTGVYFQSLASSTSEVGWMFKRAPGFMDVVCYTGTGSVRTVTHNLGVAPELAIVKKRSSATTSDWVVQTSYNSFGNSAYLNLSDEFAYAQEVYSPTATTFTTTNGSRVNDSGQTYVAYLFATCAGVSKVGVYTGTGATQTISCGFAGGARFVLIKRFDFAANWFVWDTARGMVAGTDPSLSLNSTAAESNVNWVYSTTGGFQIVTSNAGVNASGGTYIFLAIA